MILKFFLIFSLFLQSSAEIEIPERRNLSEMATGKWKNWDSQELCFVNERSWEFRNCFAYIFNRKVSKALSEIFRGLKMSRTVAILKTGYKNSTEFNEFILEIHRHPLKTCIFNEVRSFFKFIESNLKGSLEVAILIFNDPRKFIPKVIRNFTE